MADKGPKPFLTVHEVAEMFRVSTKTVVRWANEGKLQHGTTLGGHRRFPREVVEKVAGEHGLLLPEA